MGEVEGDCHLGCGTHLGFLAHETGFPYAVGPFAPNHDPAGSVVDHDVHFIRLIMSEVVNVDDSHTSSQARRACLQNISVHCNEFD